MVILLTNFFIIFFGAVVFTLFVTGIMILIPNISRVVAWMLVRESVPDVREYVWKLLGYRLESKYYFLYDREFWPMTSYVDWPEAVKSHFKRTEYLTSDSAALKKIKSEYGKVGFCKNDIVPEENDFVDDGYDRIYKRSVKLLDSRDMIDKISWLSFYIGILSLSSFFLPALGIPLSIFIGSIFYTRWHIKRKRYLENVDAARKIIED